MSEHNGSAGRLRLFLSVSMILAGCVGRTPPARFYTVPALPASAAPAEGLPAGSGEIPLAIGPVLVPRHLDRPQILRYRRGSELSFSEFDRWAGTLQGNVLAVLDQNLSHLLNTSRVVRFPWLGTLPVDYWVTVTITEWDASPDGEVTLAVRWRVHGSTHTELYASRTTRAVARAESPTVPALVDAMGENLARLSREIAEEILRIRAAGVEPARSDDDKLPAAEGDSDGAREPPAPSPS